MDNYAPSALYHGHYSFISLITIVRNKMLNYILKTTWHNQGFYLNINLISLSYRLLLAALMKQDQ